MVRAALVSIVLCALVVLTSFASSPPNLERTLATQQEHVARNPYDAEAHNDLGNLLILARRDPEAEAAYQRAVELDPGNTAARFNLALLMHQQGRLEEAQDAYGELLAIDPHHGWAHYQRGVLYGEQGNRSKALEHYARAFAYDPALSFASENPHVIDNELATEALLMADRYRTSAAVRVPRQYSDPQRIADMMLEGVEDGEGEANETGKADEVERPGAKTGGQAAAGDLQDPGGARVRQRDRSRLGQEPAAEDDEEAGEGPEGRPRRVVGPQDTSGQVGYPAAARPPATRPVTRAPGTPPAPPGSAAERQEATEERFKALRERMRAGSGAPAPEDDAGDDAVTGDDAQNAPTRTRVAPRRPRYRPGSASTGRLELRLLPEEPAERHVALGR